MARPLRIEWPGALYHLTDRGNERREVFRNDLDRRRFLRYLEEAVERFDLRIHAYCLMPNHYHLEVETPRGNLSAAMQWIKTSYTIHFNRRHDRVGHLFQGRYMAALVEKEKHLLALTRYIHLNPVRARLAAEPDDYPWSSYRQYITGNRLAPWLNTTWTLERFGGDHREGRDRYRRYVEEGIRAEPIDPLHQAVSGVILGGKDFVERVRERFLDNRSDKPAVRARKPLRVVPLEKVIRVVSALCDSDEEEIRRRGRHGNVARQLAMFLAQRHCGLTNARIGAEFGKIEGTNVSYNSRKVEERVRRERKFRELLQRAEENLFYEG